jgi:hypothetical protein
MVGAQHGEQGEFLVAFRTRRGSEYEQRLALVRLEQELAVEVQLSDLGMDESLGFAPPQAHLVALPQPGELIAGAQQDVRQVRRGGAGPVPGDSRAQQRDVDPAVVVVLLGVVPLTSGRVGEPAVRRTAGVAGVSRRAVR